jgi:uncharacterized protein YbaA (DUF1428 family)
MPGRPACKAGSLKSLELDRMVWLEHGVLSHAQNRAHEVLVGNITSFPKAAILEPREIVWCA